MKYSEALIKHQLFLRWWLFITLVVSATAYMVADGVFVTIWENDATKLSFVLFGLFGIMSGWCGYKTYRLSKFIDEGGDEPHLIDRIERLMEVGWFTSDLCLTIGMVGTVVGFIMMLSGFATVNIADVKTVQSLIRELGVGMSTALYTTLTGLICGALLKIQYFNLNQAIDRIQKNEEKLSH